MEFRIRRTDSDDAAVIDAADVRYRAHLDEHRPGRYSDLWRFFYWDAFHDGWVTSFSVATDLASIELSMVCPNIKRVGPDGDFEFESAEFRCTFRGIAHMAMECPSPEDLGPGWWGMLLHTEIDTSPLLPDLSGDDVDYQSLMIQFLQNDTEVWLELVFEQLSVEAVEPVAFALMEGDARFVLPFYEFP